MTVAFSKLGLGAVLALMSTTPVWAESFKLSYGWTTDKGEIAMFDPATGQISDNGSQAVGAGATAWNPEKGGATDDEDGTGLVSFKFDKFHNPASVFFSTTSANGAVRFVKNEDANRKLYAQSDSYDLRTSSDKKPKEHNRPVGFLAIASTSDLHHQSNDDDDYKDDTNTKPKNRTVSSALLHDRDVSVAAVRYGTSDDAALQARLSVNGTGSYRMTFEQPFNDVPVVIVTYNGFVSTTKTSDWGQHHAHIRSVYVADVNTTYADIGITDETGAMINGAFTAIAIGRKSANANMLLSDMKIAYGRYELGSHTSISDHVIKTYKGGDDSTEVANSSNLKFDNSHAKPNKWTFGDGMGPNLKFNEASYHMNFDTPFTSVPFVVATVEHASERHLRQPQVMATASDTTFQVIGRTKCCGKGTGNDARYSILAIAPK